jgi:hypothetical protein
MDLTRYSGLFIYLLGNENYSKGKKFSFVNGRGIRKLQRSQKKQLLGASVKAAGRRAAYLQGENSLKRAVESLRH